MSISRKAEARLLNRTELELMEPTHYPSVCRLDLNELRSQRHFIRECRDKARDRARQQRREMYGKAEPCAAAEALDTPAPSARARSSPRP